MFSCLLWKLKMLRRQFSKRDQIRQNKVILSGNRKLKTQWQLCNYNKNYLNQFSWYSISTHTKSEPSSSYWLVILPKLLRKSVWKIISALKSIAYGIKNIKYSLKVRLLKVAIHEMLHFSEYTLYFSIS